MKNVKIGCPTIFVPNMFGIIIKETSKTFTVKVTKIDFTKKSSSVFTHKFTAHDRQFFKQRIGKEIKFWKKSQLEVGGEKFILWIL